MKKTVRRAAFYLGALALAAAGIRFSLLPAQPAGFQQIAEGLYVVPDACNVYVIKRGDRAILIDSGEGRVIDLAGEMGIRSFDWVLHTHAHRDQCAATPGLAASGTKVAVPVNDARFFEDVAGYWNAFDIYIRYQFKPDTFKPRENIRVDRKLADGEVFQWEDVRISVVETTGHTLGAASYIVDIGGKRYAFTGDMIYSPGKVWNLYSFDHRYWDGGWIGIKQDLEGLDKLIAQGVQVFLPSHGDPVEQPAAAVSLLREHLEPLYDFGPEPEDRSSRPSSQSETSLRPWRKVS